MPRRQDDPVHRRAAVRHGQRAHRPVLQREGPRLIGRLGKCPRDAEPVAALADAYPLGLSVAGELASIERRMHIDDAIKAVNRNFALDSRETPLGEPEDDGFTHVHGPIGQQSKSDIEAIRVQAARRRLSRGSRRPQRAEPEQNPKQQSIRDQVVSHRRASRRDVIRNTAANVPSTASCGHRSSSGRSRQNTLRYASSAQPLNVSNPNFCIVSLIRKRGNILPPAADMARMMIVDNPESCARDRLSVANTSPKAAAAALVKTVTMKNPGRWLVHGKPKTN